MQLPIRLWLAYYNNATTLWSYYQNLLCKHIFMIVISVPFPCHIARDAKPLISEVVIPVKILTLHFSGDCLNPDCIM